ncbi:MAG: UDP-N-acetylglucosamine diphosphorylase [Zetaproteobacteria bacterium]|nr:UDP-N-acetylglucosamine diphosphorylase [Zetaproteobacteria bacterium]
MTNHLYFSDLFRLHGLHGSEWFPQSMFDLLGDAQRKWVQSILVKLGETKQLGDRFPRATFCGPVYVADDVQVEPTAMIVGPTYVGPGSTIRHGAYIRGNVYLGAECVVGHATEVKDSVFLDGAKAAHFAYLGNSVLGNQVNLGAGTKVANLRLDRQPVKITHPVTGERLATGEKKMGAWIGDGAQTGCNSVLSPGTILRPNAIVMPCEHVSGTR